VRRGNDEVDLLDDALAIGLVVVDENAAGGFDDADAFIRGGGGNSTDIGTGNFFIPAELQQTLGGVNKFNQPGQWKARVACTGLPPKVL
jgi:hypothetical protein